MDSLPNEILLEIINKLKNWKDIVNTSSVNKRMNSLCHIKTRCLYYNEKIINLNFFMSWYEKFCFFHLGDNIGKFYREIISGNNFASIKWFLERNLRNYKNIEYFAAALGNLKVLKFLKENNVDFNERVFSYAVGSGNFKMMVWLKENNCPWNESACDVAAYFGNFEAFVWLKENNCPMGGENICTFAGIGGNLKIVEFLVEKDYNINEDYIELFEREAIEWIEKKNYRIYYSSNCERYEKELELSLDEDVFTDSFYER